MFKQFEFHILGVTEQVITPIWCDMFIHLCVCLR